MKWTLLILLLLTTGVIHHAQPELSAPRGMSSTQIINGLLSSNASLKDRAAFELKRMSAETAEKMGAELSRYGMRECQLVLACLAAADTTPAAMVALSALEKESHEVRTAALDVVTRVSPGVASEAAQRGLNAARIEALRKLIEDGRYMKGYCLSVSPDPAADETLPVEETLRMVVFLDRRLGASGLAMLLGTCAELMLGEQEAEDEPHTLREQALRLRRAAETVFRMVWILDPAKQFNYIAASPFAEREKAVAQMREALSRLENAEPEYNDAKFKGRRYGDYLFQLAEGSEVTEHRAAAYLRLQWWRGQQAVINGEGYAAAVDGINRLGTRGRSRLRAELKKWWVEYRVGSDS